MRKLLMGGLCVSAFAWAAGAGAEDVGDPHESGSSIYNKGSFSREDAFRIIDGRKPVKGHGGADMPVWGDAFKTSRTGFSEDAVKLKVDALVDYLESIQAKKDAK